MSGSWYCPQCGRHNIVAECWQCSTPRPGISARIGGAVFRVLTAAVRVGRQLVRFAKRHRRDDRETCPECGGRGVVNASEPDAGVIDVTETCPRCEGDKLVAPPVTVFVRYNELEEVWQVVGGDIDGLVCEADTLDVLVIRLQQRVPVLASARGVHVSTFNVVVDVV